MDFLIDRTLIIALAIVGAGLATAGSVWRSRGRSTARWGNVMLWAGYLVSFASVILFVTAGFLSDR